MSESIESDAREAQRVSGLLEGLVDYLPAMIAYWGADLRCRFANRAYETWFGVTAAEVIGRDMEEFLGPLFVLNRPYVEGALRGEPQEFDLEIPDPAGGPPRHSQAHYIPDVVDGEVRGFCVLVADITRRKKAEEALQALERQVHASERFAAMATLAAGMAHEINNPLASVLANLELAVEDLDRGAVDPASLRPALGDARDAAIRIRDIIKSVRMLTGGDTSARELVDVDDAVDQGIQSAAPHLRYRARLVREAGRPGFVHGNAAQVVQALVILLLNASEALSDDTVADNEIQVSTRRVGDRIFAEVRDNGRGIPVALQARIFEPFFTTKGVGGGMGLGLSIARAIVGSFGGTLSVRSEGGRGSVFVIDLPAAAPPVDAAPVRPAMPATAPAPVTAAARPRLLIIDDEVLLARNLKRYLDRTFDVVVCNHGSAALEHLLGDPPMPVDLILCDLMMPGVGGQDVYMEVARRRPELAKRFLFMTGGAFTPRGREFLESLPVPVLEKPFDLSELVAHLWAQLGRARASAT